MRRRNEFARRSLYPATLVPADRVIRWVLYAQFQIATGILRTPQILNAMCVREALSNGHPFSPVTEEIA